MRARSGSLELCLVNNLPHPTHFDLWDVSAFNGFKDKSSVRFAFSAHAPFPPPPNKGSVDEVTGSVEVTNCFAVQHSDKQDEVFLDKKFQQTMSELHFRGLQAEQPCPPPCPLALILTSTPCPQPIRPPFTVNPREVVVGWYATSMDGVSIVDSSSLIHDFFASECADPVHLVIDTVGLVEKKRSTRLWLGEGRAG